ncbi:calcineurin-like phosphoesterase [Algibacter lectus]|nr:calcineurin-like phosphoesterase [Algibacter lectus]
MWTGFDMVNDFYKLRSADQLAFTDIGENRLKAYQFICEELKDITDEKLKLWLRIFEKSRKGAPSNHFRIDLEADSIKNITP